MRKIRFYAVAESEIGFTCSLAFGIAVMTWAAGVGFGAYFAKEPHWTYLALFVMGVIGAGLTIAMYAVRWHQIKAANFFDVPAQSGTFSAPSKANPTQGETKS